MLSKDNDKHVSNNPVTFVTHEHFAVLFFLPSCCVNSLFTVCRRPRPLPGKNPGDKAAWQELLTRGEERCASLPNAYGTHLVHLKQRSQPGLVSTVKSRDLTVIRDFYSVVNLSGWSKLAEMDV